MEIGVQTKFSKKFRVLTILYSIITYTIGFVLIKYFFLSTQDPIYWVLSQGALTGLLFGIVFPPMMIWLSKKMNKNLVLDTGVELNENELIEAQGPANLFRKIEGVGGKLFLTNERAIFNSHKLNIQSGATVMPFSEIESVQPRKTSGFINNGISIKLKSGEEYKFVVNDRDTWLRELNTRL